MSKLLKIFYFILVKFLKGLQKAVSETKFSFKFKFPVQEPKNMLRKLHVFLPKKATNLHSNSSFFTVAVRNATSAQLKPQVKQRDWAVQKDAGCDKEKTELFVQNHYLKEKPLAKALIPGQQPERFSNLMSKALCQNLSVIAKKTSGSGGDNKSCGDILGACINERSTTSDGIELEKMAKGIKGNNLRKFMETRALVRIISDVNEKLCQPEIFHVGTLAVDKSYWGEGIGLELVRESLELAAEKKFKYAKMTCMCENTRKIAEHFGMKKIWSSTYRDILNQCGEKPRAYPENPHERAYVYYLELKYLPLKC